MQFRRLLIQRTPVFGQPARQPVQAVGPASGMVVALGVIGEPLVGECKLGARAARRQLHCDQGLARLPGPDSTRFS